VGEPSYKNSKSRFETNNKIPSQAEVEPFGFSPYGTGVFLCRSFRRRDTGEIAVIPLEIGRAGEVAFEKVSAPRNLDEGEMFGNGVRGWESEISAHYGQ